MYTSKDGSRYYGLAIVGVLAKKKGHDVWNRYQSNVHRDKYNLKEAFGVTLINVDTPNKDPSCSVTIVFKVKATK